MRVRRAVIAQVLTLAAVAAGAPAAGASARPLALGPLATPLTCPMSNCIFGSPLDLVFSSDGRFAYATFSPHEDTDIPGAAVVVLARDANTGALSQIACISDTGSDGACANGNGLEGVFRLALTPDGAVLYVGTRNGLATFARDPRTGLIDQTDCLSNEPTGPACRSGPVLPGHRLLITPDGADLYVAGPNGLLQFRRTDDGPLQPAGCLARRPVPACEQTDSRLPVIADLAVDATGTRLFVVGNGLATLARNPETGALSVLDCRRVSGCTPDANLQRARTIAVSATGRHVYAATAGNPAQLEGALATYTTDPGTGVLTAGPCYATRWGADFAGCEELEGLDALEQLALSANGRRLWADGQLFRPDAESGALTAIGCNDDRLGCSWLAARFAEPVWGPAGELYLLGGLYSFDPARPKLAVLRPAAWVATDRARVVSEPFARVRIKCPSAHAAACTGRISLITLESEEPVGRGHYYARSGATVVEDLQLDEQALARLAERGWIGPRVLLHDTHGVLAPSEKRIIIERPASK